MFVFFWVLIFFCVIPINWFSPMFFHQLFFNRFVLLLFFNWGKQIRSRNLAPGSTHPSWWTMVMYQGGSRTKITPKKHKSKDSFSKKIPIWMIGMLNNGLLQFSVGIFESRMIPNIKQPSPGWTDPSCRASPKQKKGYPECHLKPGTILKGMCKFFQRIFVSFRGNLSFFWEPEDKHKIFA